MLRLESRCQDQKVNVNSQKLIVSPETQCQTRNVDVKARKAMSRPERRCQDPKVYAKTKKGMSDQKVNDKIRKLTTNYHVCDALPIRRSSTPKQPPLKWKESINMYAPKEPFTI